MEFNLLIKKNILSKFKSYGFELVEEYKNVISVASDAIKISFVFNELEGVCYFFIGCKDSVTYELTKENIKRFFNTEVSLTNLKPKKFIENLSMLLDDKLFLKMLQGELSEFIKIKQNETEEYTQQLLYDQWINIADKAWSTKDYDCFVNAVNKIGLETMPKNYTLKYNYARRAIKK